MTAPILSFNTDFSEVAALGKRLPRAHALFFRETELAMERVVLGARREAVANAKHDTGDLRRHITSKVERVSDGVLGTIGSNAPHAETIEKGRRPNKKMPPPGVLLGWMRRKGIPATEQSIKGTRRVRNEKGEVIGSIIRENPGFIGPRRYLPIEFLIARKIGKLGFEGDHNMEKAVKSREKFAKAEFAGIGPRVIQRLVKAPA